MAQPKDQVFQLSLTEIAFIICFLLLLLLGYVVFKEESDRKMAEAALANVEANVGATAAMRTAKAELAKQLEAGGAKNPHEIISNLVAAESFKNERDRLKARVDDLNAKLTAMVALDERLARATPKEREQLTKDEVVSALALQDQVTKAVAKDNVNNSSKPSVQAPPTPGVVVPGARTAAPVATQELLPFVKRAIKTSETLKTEVRKSLSKDLTPGREDEQIAEIVQAASKFGITAAGAKPGDIAKENSDLRGQVAFLKNRLDARGGRDFPPCWADETGKVEYLFALETRSDTVVISPAWTERREASARALPGLDDALNGPHAHQDFPRRMKAIFDWSKAQSPECRHYVQLRSSIADAVQSDRARLMVENYFYKVESRR